MMIANNAIGTTPSMTIEQNGWVDYEENMLALNFLGDNFSELATAEAVSDQVTESEENPLVSFDLGCFPSGDDLDSAIVEYIYSQLSDALIAPMVNAGYSHRRIVKECSYDINFDNLVGYFESLFNTLSANSPMTKEAMQADIENFIGSIAYNYQDDFAALFMVILNDCEPSLFDTLVEPTELGEETEWAARIWNTFINNGKKDPYNKKEVKNLLQEQGLVFG